MRFHRWVALVLVVSAALSVMGSPSEGAPLDPRELTARKEFAAGRYSQSVEIFAQLFAETGDPVFLRNIARCYQKMQRPDEAISNFQEYLAKGNVSRAERAEIGSYVHEMETLKRQRALSPPPLPVAPTTAGAPGSENAPAPIALSPAATAAPAIEGPSLPTAGPPATEARTQALTQSRSQDDTLDAKRSWRIAGIATAAAGAALVGTGVAFGLAAQSASNDVSGPSGRYSPQRDSDGKRDEKIQWIAYGVGAAVLATGGLLYFYASRRDEHAAGVHMNASLWPPTVAMEARF